MQDGLVRLTEPLVREGGSLRPASWEEALTMAAAGFEAARRNGPQAFGMFSCAASKPDRKSTRLNSSHQISSYAVFCLKKKNDLDLHRPASCHRHLRHH